MPRPRLPADDWKKQLTETLPTELKGILPTVEEIEAELSSAVTRAATPSRRGKSGGTVREAPATYGTDRVRVVDAPFETDGAETPFGRRWGGGTATLSAEYLAALTAGKTLALDVRDEYVMFLKADGSKGKRPNCPKRGRRGG